MTDPIVESVIQKHRKRSEAGIRKYGVTMARTDVNHLQWLVHHQEELMDAAIYCERIIQEEVKRELEKYSQLTTFCSDETPKKHLTMAEVLDRSV